VAHFFTPISHAKYGCFIPFLALVTLNCCRTATPHHRDPNDLAPLADAEPNKGKGPVVKAALAIDLSELSAIALRQSEGVGPELVIAGDDKFAISVQPLTPEGLPLGLAKNKNLEHPAKDRRSSQWEALAIDQAGKMVFLVENPPQLEVASPNAEHLHHSIALDFSSLDLPDDRNSLGEGLLLLRNGHVIVAKEKNPVLIIEFGPKGSHSIGIHRDSLVGTQYVWPVDTNVRSFVPLNVWVLADATAALMKDISDLAVSPSGAVYMLSDISKRIIRIESRVRPEEAKISAKAYWNLPSPIEKPEGLVFAGDHAIVCTDVPSGTRNLFFLDLLHE